jgi:hypothetical protein
MPEAAMAPDTPADSPMTLQDVMASAQHRDLSTKLAVGDPAFPFRLPVLGASGPTGEHVSLGTSLG